MDDRKKNRVQHYCKLLRLPAWDTKDLLQYISIYFDAPRSIEFMSIKTKILKLDIMNVAERLIEYLEIEEQNFREYKAQFSETPNDMIWLKVYQEMDNIIKHEISEAKAIANINAANRGCYVIVILIMLFLVYFCLF